MKEKLTKETVPGTIIQKIVTRPGRPGKHESIAVDSINPDWCSNDCKGLNKGKNGRSREVYGYEKYNYSLRSKQGNPVRCKRCREMFAIQREVA